MREKQIEYLLNADTRFRAEFKLQRGRVVEFVVQLELLEDDEWLPIVRYDTAHGFPHRDRYLPDGTVSRHEQLPVSDIGYALTHAIQTIKRDWSELCREFATRRARSRKRP